MISHVSVGVRDIGRQDGFMMRHSRRSATSAWSTAPEALGYGADGPAFWVLKVERPVPADPASGLHFCLDATSRAAVDHFHAAALKNGGKDNGKPGIRKDYGEKYYAAFVIDPEGYRLEAYCGK